MKKFIVVVAALASSLTFAQEIGTEITPVAPAPSGPQQPAPEPGYTPKPAVEQKLSAEKGAFGIRANCIAPETILTERSARQIPDDMKARMASEHPLARLGTVEDVANAALFLASDDASWITGIVVDVAGGAVMPR